MRVFVLLLLLAIPVELQAQSNSEQSNGKAYDASRIALYSSTAFDITTTERVLRAGGRELNPIAGQNPYRRNAIVIGSTVAADLLTRWLRKKGSPRLATVLNFTISGLHFGAGIHNARQLRFR